MNPASWITQADEVRILKQIAEALNEAVDMPQAMAALLPQLSELLGLTTAWAFRYDPRQASFVEMGASGLPPALAADGARPLRSSWCECQERFVQGKLDTAINIVRCSRLKNAEGDKAGLRFHASVPLKTKGRPLGILNLAADGQRVFTAPTLEFLRAVGHQVAVALDRAALLADIRQKNDHLRALNEIAQHLARLDDPSAIVRTALEQLAARLQLEAVGLVTEPPVRVLYRVHRPEVKHEAIYSYDADAGQRAPASERILLEETRSFWQTPLPQTAWSIRIESSLANAFGPSHHDLLTAFGWHVQAALDHARLNHLRIDRAKWLERRRLAADLHDQVSQRLFSAQLMAEALRTHITARRIPRTTVHRLSDRLDELLQQSRVELRSVIDTLRSPEPGMRRRVTEKIQALRDIGPWTVNLTLDDVALSRLTPAQSEELLAILDEALQNVMKHAGPCRVHVRLDTDDGIVRLIVTDNGQGFDVDKAPEGFGLVSMRERADRLGAAFHIESAADHGTRIQLHIPWGASL
ncbi:putative signal transduction histidine kinase [Sulfobacillus acidophilus DSM 10332]|uniref:histidine kinase n=1 Tax=Sulfobacillus acidophilus (strain ATCC 700253 / DSM 10332 / NAL) TaxID=679936 RepID=G8TW13_SULAD|nr:putative signal transduction histidine kinase [Sulfobacillus acidophilus DSM 10332]